MEPESRSDVHPTRSARPFAHGSLTGHGDGGRRKSTSTFRSSRRKHSAESAETLAEENRSRDQENKHQRSSSTDTIRLRSAKSIHVAAARNLALPATTSSSSTTTSTSTSAGAVTNKPNQKLKKVPKSAAKFKPFRLQSTNVSVVDETHRSSAAPRKQRDSRKADRAPKRNKEATPSSDQSPSASIDVGPADFAFDTDSAFNYTFSSLNELDDLARWDMDSLPFPSPPDSPAAGQPAPAPNYSNPFSSGLDDDPSLLENEIPLPSSRSRVVLENMGVKKSKNAAASKGRNLGVGATLLSRQVPFPTVSTSTASSVPPQATHCQQQQQSHSGLPPPLPLRTLCQNSNAPHPLVDIASPQGTHGRSPLLSRPLVMSGSSSSGCPSDSGYGSTAQEKKKKEANALPSKTRRDAWGCMHLGAEDCELSLMFPQTSHYEVWDMGEESYFAVPILLCLMAKDSMAWTGIPLAMPDVSLIDLRCDDIPLPVPSHRVAFDPSFAYSTSFLGGKSALEDSANLALGMSTGRGMGMMSSVKKREEEQTIGPKRISIDGKWVRTYAKPGVEGRFGGNSKANTNSQKPTTSQYASRGWYLKFWVPIPIRLFAKCETRAFRVHARVWMMGDEERVLSLDRYESGIEMSADASGKSNEESQDSKGGYPYPLAMETEFTASHLRKEREMGRWW